MIWDNGYLEFLSRPQLLLIIFAVWTLIYILSFFQVDLEWIHRVLFTTFIWFVVIGSASVIDAFVIIYYCLGG